MWHRDNMESVISPPQITSLADALKGMEQIAAEQKKRLAAVCNSVFDYERERIFLGEPTQAELAQFATILKQLRALAEAIDVDWLVDRLTVSVQMLENPMSDEEADAFLAKHFPE
jgi:hypothetical protein